MTGSNAGASDRALEEIRSRCLALPEATEVEAWGHPSFRAGKKMFAAYGVYSGEPTLSMKVGHDRQEELLQDSRFFPTPYAARQGWVSILVDRKTDWNEMGALLREAYRQVALKRMLAALDAAT
jgi:predicted DNA-binding protein (MmcQ/YjbR family)